MKKSPVASYDEKVFGTTPNPLREDSHQPWVSGCRDAASNQRGEDLRRLVEEVGAAPFRSWKQQQL